ncbi:MAG: hypothetical protein E7I52_06325, partial [Klebsiella michiganensis]|nr:hypothetical protein [Klebsiella michiganensis]
MLRLIIPTRLADFVLEIFSSAPLPGLFSPPFFIGNKRIVSMYKNILVPVDVFEIGLADKALSH